MHSEVKTFEPGARICFPAKSMQIRVVEGWIYTTARLFCALAALAFAASSNAQFANSNLMAATAAVRSLLSATNAAAPASTTFTPVATATPATNAASSNVPTISIRDDMNDTHLIRPGDKLSFRIDEDREDPRLLPVTDSGEIELPYNLGRFKATDKTCRKLAQEIKTAVEKDYYNRATVHLGIDTVNAVRGKVYVQGQVTKPGPVTVPSDSVLKLSQALLLAGPPTQWAKLSAVRVVRGVGKAAKTFVINAEEFNRGSMENDIALEPEDWIIVPERGLVF